eukprot:GHVS01018633.1.p1 GENE.GHVS01018633.1~~GHVS01018633.1.p1  ORF type:complete len:713 (-),score=151.21 GHVS01018633.1:401-2539(-)
MTNYDIVIIGAGNAGCLLALALSSSTSPPPSIALLDHDWSEQKRVVAELLQPRAVDVLRQMGFGDIMGMDVVGAVPCFGYTIVNPHCSHIPLSDAPIEEFQRIPTEQQQQQHDQQEQPEQQQHDHPAQGSHSSSFPEALLTYPPFRPATSLNRFGFISCSSSHSSVVFHPPRTPVSASFVEAATQRLLRPPPPPSCFFSSKSSKVSPGSTLERRMESPVSTASTAAPSTPTPSSPFHFGKKGADGGGGGLMTSFGMASGCSTEGLSPPSSPVVEQQESYPLPQPLALCMHNGRLVQQLRLLALQKPNIHCLKGSALSMISSSPTVVGGVRCRPPTSSSVVLAGSTSVHDVPPSVSACPESVHAPLTILCDGGATPSLRRSYNPTAAAPALVSSWIGLLLTHPPWESPVPNPGYAAVVLSRPSPVLVYQVAATHTRVLVCVDGTHREQIGLEGWCHKYLLQVVAPQLPHGRLRDMFVDLITNNSHLIESSSSGGGGASAAAEEEEVALVLKHNYRSVADKPYSRGLLALGDSLNMRHALTGGGMTVLVNDVQNLSGCLRNVDTHDHDAVEDAVHKFLRSRRNYAGTINTLAMALHDIFSTPYPMHYVRCHLAEACYQYLSKGGVTTQGPVGLLSGLAASPTVLSTHFFVVVFYAVWKQMKLFSFLSFRRDLKNLYNILHEGVRIVMPLFVSENVTILSSSLVSSVINLFFPFK